MPYIPRQLLDRSAADMAEPSYRMSMLPFATYPNADGSGEHLGFALPGMIAEPANAFMRLIGTPSHPGTFTQGPDVGVAWDNPLRSEFPNRQDMTTLLETATGGSAARGAAAGARALPSLADATSQAAPYSGRVVPSFLSQIYADQRPSLWGSTLAGARDQLQAAYRTVRHPFASATIDDPTAMAQWQEIARLQQEIRNMDNTWGAERHVLRLINPDDTQRYVPGIFNDESLAPISSYDMAALNQSLRRRMVDEGTLYAGGHPSLWSSAVLSQSQTNPQPSDGLAALGAYRRGGFVRAA